MIKNPPCNAGGVGLIPDLRTKTPHVTGQLSRCTTTRVPHVPGTAEPTCSRACVPQQETSVCHRQRKPTGRNKDSEQPRLKQKTTNPKINKKKTQLCNTNNQTQHMNSTGFWIRINQLINLNK